MERHQYRSVPVTVMAVQIPDLVDDLTTDVTDAFGEQAHDHLIIDTTPTTTDDDAPHRVVRVSMTTVQGQLVTALPGEWIAQEHDDATRFYPIADEAMRRRYLVPKRRRS